MTEQKFVPAIVDDFCECLIAQLDDVLHYTCSEYGLPPTTLICKDSLIKLIHDIKQDYHDKEEIIEILKMLYSK